MHAEILHLLLDFLFCISYAIPICAVQHTVRASNVCHFSLIT